MSMDVKILNLEVRFEIDAGDQEASFARMFTKYINLWHQMATEQREQAELTAADRSLGDEPKERY